MSWLGFGKRILQSRKMLLLEWCAVRRCCWKGRCGMRQALASCCLLPQCNHPPSLCPALVMLLETCSFCTFVHRGAGTPPNAPFAASGVLRRVIGAQGGCYKLFGMGTMSLKELGGSVPSTEKLSCCVRTLCITVKMQGQSSPRC